jgi:Aspartyl protease
MPDYGADDNVVSQQTVRALSKSGIFVPTQTLDKPITLQLTAKETTAIAAETVELTLTLQLEAGPLRMRNVRFLVLEADFDEVLLGRPIMNLLGIDVTGHLNTVRTEFHDMDFSGVHSIRSGISGHCPEPYSCTLTPLLPARAQTRRWPSCMTHATV